jgi:tRNA(Met) C34 N-acetyltransferase TmcA
MVRPVSERGRALLSRLRADLARDLPLQLELLGAEGELSLDPALEGELSAGLPQPSSMSDEMRSAIVASYAFGPRPYESAALGVSRWVETHAARLAELSDAERTLIEARIRRRRAWAVAARDAGFETVPAAMRALRRAIRALVDLAEPELRELRP